MIYAFLIALAAGGIGMGVFAAMWKGAQRALAIEQGSHEKTKTDLVATVGALSLSEAARAEEKARLEAVIAAKKTEIAALEADTHACNSPDLLRARLRGLLAPAPASSPGGALVSSVPVGGAAKPPPGGAGGA